MINNSPWLFNARKTAAGMTARTANGIRILQGRRARGMSNPSPEVLQNQKIAAILWPLFRAAAGMIRDMFTSVPSGQYAANQWFSINRVSAIDLTDPENPVLDPTGLIYQRGLMTPTDLTSAVADTSLGTVVINWPTLVADSSQDALDLFTVVIRDRNNGNVTSIISGSERSTGTFDYTVPVGFLVTGNVLDIYGSFMARDENPNHGLTSETRRINTTVVA